MTKSFSELCEQKANDNYHDIKSSQDFNWLYRACREVDQMYCGPLDAGGVPSNSYSAELQTSGRLLHPGTKGRDFKRVIKDLAIRRGYEDYKALCILTELPALPVWGQV